MKLTKLTTFAALAASLALYSSAALAQDNTGGAAGGGAAAGGGNQGGGGGGRRGGGQGGQGGGNFDPAQFQQRMNDRLKQALKVSDDEWNVIQPLLQKVQEKQREAGRGGMGGMGGGRRGGGQGGPGGQASPGAQPAADQGNQNNRQNRGGGSPEADALQTALQNDGTSAEEIKTKLTALRQSRKKSQAELEQARADLSKILTVKQEAALVLMGMLE
jgi:hypothetical protein